MYTGKLVFSQVMDHLPRRNFHQFIKQHSGNHKVKSEVGDRNLADAAGASAEGDGLFGNARVPGRMSRAFLPPGQAAHSGGA